MALVCWQVICVSILSQHSHHFIFNSFHSGSFSRFLTFKHLSQTHLSHLKRLVFLIMSYRKSLDSESTIDVADPLLEKQFTHDFEDCEQPKSWKSHLPSRFAIAIHASLLVCYLLAFVSAFYMLKTQDHGPDYTYCKSSRSCFVTNFRSSRSIRCYMAATVARYCSRCQFQVQGKYIRC